MKTSASIYEESRVSKILWIVCVFVECFPESALDQRFGFREASAGLSASGLNQEPGESHILIHIMGPSWSRFLLQTTEKCSQSQKLKKYIHMFQMFFFVYIHQRSKYSQFATRDNWKLLKDKFRAVNNLLFRLFAPIKDAHITSVQCSAAFQYHSDNLNDCVCVFCMSYHWRHHERQLHLPNVCMASARCERIKAEPRAV